MPFKKGEKNSGNRKGRKNKKTIQWETFSKYCLNGGLVKFQKELNKLTGKDYVNAFTALLEFHKPKLERTELTGAGGKDLINIPPIHWVTTKDANK